MAVKESATATRVLNVLEAIAAHQPIGVGALSRMLDVDKSAVQRAIVTLAKAGWIAASADRLTQWVLTPRILTIAHSNRNRDDLRHQTQAVLERLAADSGETAMFNELDGRDFVVVQTVESTQPLRMAPRVGTRVPIRDSATGQVSLAFLGAGQQADLLGAAPDEALRGRLAAWRAAGVAISDAVDARSISIAAPVFEVDGRPIGAIAITAPADRLRAERHDDLALLVRRAARLLSRGHPPGIGSAHVPAVSSAG